MKARPIIFSAPMVRALLDGAKTQTREIVKPQPISGKLVKSDAHDRDKGYYREYWLDRSKPREMPSPPNAPGDFYMMPSLPIRVFCPYGQPGARLWVRERHALENRYRNVWCRYAADDARMVVAAPELVNVARPDWRSSTQMPRWASRITLEISGVRVERLQNISEDDAIAEGIDRVENNFGNGPAYCDYRMARPKDTAEWFASAIASYESLWGSINGAGSWDANPWVWRIEFRVISEGQTE